MLDALLDALYLVGAVFPLAVSTTPTPFEVPWSDDTIGPDGPWHTIAAEDGQYKLFPGSTWETWLIQDDYCTAIESGTCHAEQAGLYDKTASQGSDAGIAMPASLSNYMFGIDLAGDDATRWVDSLRLQNFEVENASLALLDSGQRMVYPSGKNHSFFAGCLSLGGSGSVNQSFTQDNASLPLTNASLIPGYMWEHGKIPSNSFGMHIGSFWPALAGSLWFGGYDQNRVIGDIITLDGDFQDGITLWDIGIDVIGSTSPFDFDAQDGLLTKGNSTIGRSLKVSIDGCSPYFSLPKSTCDNIAAYLPVTFDEDLGLYLWDTTSTQFSQIVSSASAMSFSFISSSNTDPVKIRVPFMHLNLTLEAPLVDNPTPYFPCHVNGKDKYVLGRAYLQDAFIGANWDPRSAKWWMAQAPGQNIQAVPNVATIEPTAKTISKGGNNWEASWNGIWSDRVDYTTSSSSKATPTTTSSIIAAKEEELTMGARIGIGVGVVAGLLVIALGAFFLWRRRRQQTQVSQTQIQAPSPWSEDKYSSSQSHPVEMMGQCLPAELRGIPTPDPNQKQQRYELA
ncbi:hypothetical protein B0J13DRAFT_581494 [Dactylonectria estremocensis]|uniref:Peptidase A1 domain-containing protein n=1 Tax=Dactylonectria estremocensis TaxID=1079267 RepID=A0A9P9JGM4_9HYPO|nr:hypothetical protein B0J13DRAFT_581494 [Dactylonectria estremocensis]